MQAEDTIPTEGAQPQAEPVESPRPQNQPPENAQPDVAPVVFPDLGSGEPAGGDRPATALADVALHASVEVGRIPIKLAELTTLSPGTVLHLGRGIDEPMTMRVGGRIFATCDVVVDEGHLAARVSEIGATRG